MYLAIQLYSQKRLYNPITHIQMYIQKYIAVPIVGFVLTFKKSVFHPPLEWTVEKSCY